MTKKFEKLNETFNVPSEVVEEEISENTLVPIKEDQKDSQKIEEGRRPTGQTGQGQSEEFHPRPLPQVHPKTSFPLLPSRRLRVLFPFSPVFFLFIF